MYHKLVAQEGGLPYNISSSERASCLNPTTVDSNITIVCFAFISILADMRKCIFNIYYMMSLGFKLIPA